MIKNRICETVLDTEFKNNIQNLIVLKIRTLNVFITRSRSIISALMEMEIEDFLKTIRHPQFCSIACIFRLLPSLGGMFPLGWGEGHDCKTFSKQD